MDIFSKSVLEQISNHFPELKYKHNLATAFLELDIISANNSNFGGLVIQTTVEKDIWIRNYHQYSAYSVDTTEELITIIKGVLKNKILWVVAFKDSEWFETTLINEGADIETEKGITYNVLSWSGKCDRTFKME